MENLSEWISGIALAALLGGVVCAVAPNGSCSKALRVFVAVLVLTLATVTLSKSDIDYLQFESFAADAAVSAGGTGDKVHDTLLDSAVRDTLELAAARVLSEYDTGECKITVYIAKEGDSVRTECVLVRSERDLTEYADEIRQKIIEVTGAETVEYENIIA